MLRSSHDLRWILTHELTHVAIGGRLRSLPPIIHEGICEYVAYSLSGAATPWIEFKKKLKAARFFGLQLPRFSLSQRDGVVSVEMTTGHNQLSVEELLTLDHVRRKQADDYAIAFVLVKLIVDRCGIDTFYRLNEDAANTGRVVSPEDLFSLAGLERGEDLRTFLARSLEEQPFLELVRQEAALFAEAFVPALKGTWMHPAVALAEGNPRVRLRDDSGALRLSQLPEFQRAVSAEWQTSGEFRHGTGFRVDKLFEGGVSIVFGPPE